MIGHPGHELRIHHWLEKNQPTVFVLTNGAGEAGDNRIHESARVIRRAGAMRGPWFGQLSDREIYEIILAGDAGPLIERTVALIDFLSARPCDVVVGDMIEGYNPTHDLCRCMINAAVEVTTMRESYSPLNLAFALTGHPDEPGACNAAPSRILRLDAGALDRKWAVADRYLALQDEVKSAREEFGRDAFAREQFFEADALGESPPTNPPYYEEYGSRQVDKGRYTEVLRYREHLQPLVKSIHRALGLTA